MEKARKAHCVYRCQYHIVWIPKYRYKILTNGVDKYLEIKLDEVRKHYLKIEYIEKSIQPDHIHIVVSFPPKYSIARVVQILKQTTKRALRQKFDFLKERYRGTGVIWSVGYFVSTVGLDENMIRNYVRYQEKEDLGQAKRKI
ncbi:MAG TPA: IS200/IS605 family transposase [Actinobacteria bacterium]|nr:IS200/IS605 family transposase [Actinomycetota bacterium]